MFADMLLIVKISNKNIMVKPFDTGSVPMIYWTVFFIPRISAFPLIL